MEEIIRQLSVIVSELIGMMIGVDQIRTDANCWLHYHIPTRCLQTGYPIVLRHQKGPLSMIIPDMDMKRMESGEISVEEYVNNSIWSFGFFCPGPSFVESIYWTVIEREGGIHDKKKINRYLTILGCRSAFLNMGWMADKRTCRECSVKNCPMSRFSGNHSWEGEIKERDERNLFYKTVKNRIEKDFGFVVENCMLQKGHSILLIPSQTLNPHKVGITVYLNDSLMVDLLYHPRKTDFAKLANELPMKACIPFQYNPETESIIPSKYIDVTDETDAKQICDFWRADERSRKFVEKLYTPEETGVKSRVATTESKLVSFMNKIFKRNG